MGELLIDRVVRKKKSEEHSENAQNKHILLVANAAWNIYNFRLPLIQKLYEKGYQITILAPEDDYTSYLKTLEFFTYIPLQTLKPKSLNPVKDIRLFFDLYRKYTRTRPDFILHFTVKPNIYGGLAASLTNIKYIGVITGLGYTIIRGGWLAFSVHQLYLLALKSAYRVVFQNEADLQLLDKRAQLNTTLIRGSGVNTKYFKPAPLPVYFNFLFVGRLLKDKGVLEFLQAAKILIQEDCQCDFTLVGSLNVDNPAALSKAVLEPFEEETKIQFMGQVDDVRPFIRKCTILVLPSYREGLPRSVIEAMAMARPIITTDTAGCRDTVANGKNGWLVKVKSANDLSIAMRTALNTPKTDLIQMGKKSREMVLESFDIEKVNDQFLALLNDETRS